MQGRFPIKQLAPLSLFGLSFVWSPMFGTTEALIFPPLAANPEALLLSRLCNLLGFALVMGFFSAFGRHFRAFGGNLCALLVTVVCGIAGMCGGGLCGVGALPLPFLYGAALLRGLYYGLVTILWIEVFVHLDDRLVGMAIACALIVLASACLLFVAGLFFLNDHTQTRPWGFSSLVPAESEESRLLRRCGELADQCALTSRELEILQQLAAGRANDEITAALFISPTTTKTHIRNIYAKLGVHSRHELTLKLKS